MSFLEVRNISKQLDDTYIVSNVSFIQNHQQKLAIAGETGSGKSTVLKTIAGLSQPDDGNVIFLGDRVAGPWEKLIPGHPGIAYLSQQFELPKFLRVEQVLAYANKTTLAEANELFEICRIGHLLKRKTDQLSGGEQQRIALARLLVGLPKLLLLDEPFSNLDVIHKSVLKSVIKDVEERLQVTCIIISHDPLDMLSWADEIIVMKDGRIVQKAIPQQIYHQPENAYVAGLFGKYNLLSTTLTQTLIPQLPVAENQHVFLRPEQLILSEDNRASIKGIVTQIRFMGSAFEADILVADNIITSRTNNSLRIGETVCVSILPHDVWAL